MQHTHKCISVPIYKSESCTEAPGGLGATGFPKSQLFKPADKPPLLHLPNIKQTPLCNCFLYRSFPHVILNKAV